MLRIFTLFFTLLFLLGCKENTQTQNVIKVGTISGPETELMEVAQQVAKEKYQLDVVIVTFNDYNLPNEALNDGSIDANMFQHQPFLEASVANHQYKIISVAKTFIYPMGIYSVKIKNLAELKRNATIAIPNDPSNEARALLLLQKAGLIKLAKQSFDATPKDISDNKFNLQFKELDAAQLPRALPDVDLAVINTNYAIPAGLSLTQDALFEEDKQSPYANLLVVKEKDRNDPRVKNLIEALRSKPVVEKAKKLFHDAVIVAW